MEGASPAPSECSISWIRMSPADVFASFSQYVWGRDSHDGEVYTVGATWYFDITK